MNRLLLLAIVFLFLVLSCKKQEGSDSMPSRQAASSSSEVNAGASGSGPNTDVGADVTSRQRMAGREVEGEPSHLSDYRVVKRKIVNDTLILSVRADDLNEAQQIAERLVSSEAHSGAIRLFFYSQDQQPGVDVPLIRYERAPNGSLVNTYDNRLPPPTEERSLALPEFEILFRMKQMRNGRTYGDVLVPSFSRMTSVKVREDTVRAISKQERIDDITLYSTRGAYEANDSASYLDAHPNALREGLLGVLREGAFTPGETLAP